MESNDVVSIQFYRMIARFCRVETSDDSVVFKQNADNRIEWRSIKNRLVNEIITAVHQKHRQLIALCLFYTDEVVILRIVAEQPPR